LGALKYGIIGVGHIAEHAHLPAIRPLVESGEVVLQAFCDHDAAMLAQAAEKWRPGSTYSDHHEMLDKEQLDALYVLIPPTLHTDAETIAADKGIALFVEKPVTLDMPQAYAFDAQIRKAGVVSQVGFMTRYSPAAEKVKELLADRMLRHVNVQLFYSGAPIRFWTSRMELCGGSFVENTIHTVDFIRSVFGDIDWTSAFYVPRKAGDPERGPMNLPHAYVVNYRFENETAANFTTSRCLTDAGVSRRDVLLISEGSLIEWSQSRIVENGQVVWEESPAQNAFHLQAAAFARAVKARDPGQMRSSYADALNSLAAVLAANESAARGGALVNVKQFGRGD
jgi:predicted dehydrogenase